MAKTTHPSAQPALTGRHAVPATRVPTPGEVDITNSKNVETVYSNQFGISSTVTDFTIFFLELGIIPGANGGTARHELKAAVTLPMPALEGMIDVLTQLRKQQKAKNENLTEEGMLKTRVPQ